MNNGALNSVRNESNKVSSDNFLNPEDNFTSRILEKHIGDSR